MNMCHVTREGRSGPTMRCMQLLENSIRQRPETLTLQVSQPIAWFSTSIQANPDLSRSRVTVRSPSTERVNPDYPPSDHSSRPSTRAGTKPSRSGVAIDDSAWLSRAYSLGHARQHLNLIGNALMINSLALLEHRQRAPLAA